MRNKSSFSFLKKKWKKQNSRYRNRKGEISDHKIYFGLDKQRSYAVSLSGLTRNRKHELCKFVGVSVRSLCSLYFQNVRTHYVWTVVHCHEYSFRHSQEYFASNCLLNAWILYFFNGNKKATVCKNDIQSKPVLHQLLKEQSVVVVCRVFNLWRNGSEKRSVSSTLFFADLTGCLSPRE